MDGSEEILNLLRDNARISIEDISAMTKKKPEEVEAIIRKLENDGIIMKYAAIVNPEKDSTAKEKVKAEIEIQVQPQREHGFDGIADRIYRFPQVKSLYLMSGGYDLKVIIEGDSLQEVASFVARKLSKINSAGQWLKHRQAASANSLRCLLATMTLFRFRLESRTSPPPGPCAKRLFTILSRGTQATPATGA